jgi:hypothetical protein
MFVHKVAQKTDCLRQKDLTYISHVIRLFHKQIFFMQITVQLLCPKTGHMFLQVYHMLIHDLKVSMAISFNVTQHFCCAAQHFWL